MLHPLSISLIRFIIGFILLIGGAEVLIRGASRLARRFNVPTVIIGLTIVAFGTSLPELLVTLTANLKEAGGSELAIGNIVGSNIANFGLILGVASLLGPLLVEHHLLRREYPLLLMVSLCFTGMAWDGQLARWEGVVLFASLLAFTYYSYKVQRAVPAAEILDVATTIDAAIGKSSTQPLIDLGLLGLGLCGLGLGAHWLVTAAEFIARTVGVSDLVIGLTLVAVGTSLPELATSVIAVFRKEGDIALGNVVGSNLFNMLGIGGVSATIKSLATPLSMRYLDFPVMLALSGLVYLLIWRKPQRLERWHGATLLIAYIVYLWGLFTINHSLP